jgi:tape measure domain-containing protein
VAQSTVKLIVDAQNAISPLKRVNEQTKILSSSTDKLKGRLDKSNRSLKNTGSSAKQASGGVKTLTGSLGPLLKALAAAAAIRFVFVKTAELETQRKSLEVLTGSLEKTNKIIAELQAFGAVTPFTSSELIEQSKRLKAFGFTTDELTDSVKRLSDIAGATGADLSGIATAFGQIRAKGKLQQEENLQLLERGVDITTELKRITGLQGEEFESAMRKGKIGADLVNQAFINLTNQGGAFFGGATAQADTLAGRLGFANGGRPPVGRPSIVGERGAELFVPDRAGTIIPNHELGGKYSSKRRCFWF